MLRKSTIKQNLNKQKLAESLFFDLRMERNKSKPFSRSRSKKYKIEMKDIQEDYNILDSIHDRKIDLDRIVTMN